MITKVTSIFYDHIDKIFVFYSSRWGAPHDGQYKYDLEYLFWHSRHVVWIVSQHDVQYRFSIRLSSQQLSHIWVFWKRLSLQEILSHFHHCGRMAIYSISQKTGVNATIKNTANNWNRNDELRAFASFITRINTESRTRNITIAVRNRTSFWKIPSKTDSASKGFQIASIISQLHSSIFMAVCAKSPVSMISQKI